MNKKTEPDADAGREFEEASNSRKPTLIEEIIEFIIEYKKWWLIPIVLSMLFLAAVAVLSATGAAPFIYTLF